MHKAHIIAIHKQKEVFMNITNKTHCLKNDYTYKDLTKPVNRDHMAMLDVCSLGTQSGGFGRFNEQFKVVSENGVSKIIQELVEISASNSVLINDLLDASPTLKQLISIK
jgi:hypothetical protein